MAAKAWTILIYSALIFLAAMQGHQTSAQDQPEQEDDKKTDNGVPESQQSGENGGSGSKNCRLDSFKLQEDFDLNRFQGYWYALSINRYWSHLPNFLMSKQKNIQANYRLMSDGTLEFKTAASFGPFCDYITGKGTIEEKTKPQKIEVEFKLFFDRNPRKNPYWVVKTDYEYAVIYSCWKVREDGTCDQDSAYMWTLNRKQSGHTPEQQQEIAKAAEYMCIPPGEFKTLQQDGGCRFDPDKFPGGGIGIILLVLLCVVISILIFITCLCCVCKADKELQKKKKQ